MKKRHFIGVAIIATLGACTTTPPEPPKAAVTELVATNCDASVSIANSLLMTPEKKPNVINTISTKIDNNSKCVVMNNRNLHYVVYELPNVPDNHTITLGGVMEPLRTFAAKVSLLDANGKETRVINPEKYANIGDLYGVQFRPSAEDKYILVLSNPDLVGIEKKTFDTRLNVTQMYSYNPATYGGSSYNNYRGFEANNTRVFSHEGLIEVTIQAVKGKIGLPDAK